MSTAPRDAPLRALAFMLAAASCFAFMNAIARAMRHLPWPMLAFSRAALGLCVALTIARSRGASLAIADRRVMWRRSLAGTTSMLCTFFALTHMPLADATALLNTTPLFIAALAWVTLRERLSSLVVVALGVAFAGILLVERPGLRGDGFAGLVALLAGAGSAVAMVSLRRLSGETPEAVVVHFSATATGVLGALSLAWVATRGAPAGITARELVGLLAMGALATLGQLSLTRAYALDKAARVGAAGWLQIVIALGIDAVVFARWPEVPTLGGIALLLVSGVLLVSDARRDERALRG